MSSLQLDIISVFGREKLKTMVNNIPFQVHKETGELLQSLGVKDI